MPKTQNPDLTANEHQEERMSESDSQKRIRLATKAANLGIFEWDMQNEFAVWENDEMYQIFGLSHKERPFSKKEFISQCLHPDDTDTFETAFEKSAKERKTFIHICRIRRKNDQALRWIEYTAEYEYNESDKPVRIVGVVKDITDQKQEQFKHNLLIEISEILAKLKEPEEIIQAVGHKLEKTMDISSCLFADIDVENDLATIEHIFEIEENYHPELKGEHILSEFVSDETFHSGRKILPIIIEDTQSDPRTDSANYKALNIFSFLSIPVHKNGQWKYVFTINCSHKRQWEKYEIDLIVDLTNRLALRIERARAEKAHIKSEQQLRILMDSLPVLISYTDKNHVYKYVNKTYTQWFGSKKEEIVGSHISEIIGEEAYKKIIPNIERVLSGESFTFEHYLNYKNGKRYIQVNYVPDLDENNIARGYFALVQDFSDKKREEENQKFIADLAEKLSNASSGEQLVRIAGSKINDYLEISDCSFAVLSVENDNLHTRYSWNPSGNTELYDDLNLNSILPDEFSRESGNDELIVIEDTKTDKRALPSFYKKSHIRSSIIVPYYRFEQLKYLLIVCDIEPHQWREDQKKVIADKANKLFLRLERTEAEEKIQHNNERYQTLFNSIDEGFCICKMLYNDKGDAYDYLFLEVNPAYKKLTGLKNAVGRTGRELEPNLEEKWFETYDKVVRTGKAIRFESHLKAWDSWYDLYVTPVGKSEDQQFAILFSDITQRKKFEESLKESNRRKDNFLATLAHELRNPLTPIKGAVDLLNENKDEESKQKGIDIINRQLDKVIHLVDDLMDISRITRNKIKLRKEQIDLADCISDAIETIMPLTKVTKHTIDINLPEAPVYLYADNDRITQIITNLLTNAIKYSDNGTEISVNIETNNDSVAITVKDNGIGIPKKELARIFDMFSQVSNNTSGDTGLGIGLNLVKSLTELHNGTVTVESEGEYRGSTFKVILPTNNKQPKPSTTKNSKPLLSENVTKQRIIIVDDNKDIILMVNKLLESRGFTTKYYYTGNEAIKDNDFKPDVALVDLGLPDIDGYTVGRELRAKYPDIKLIAHSGYGQEEDIRRSKEAGFDHHLVKPAGIKKIMALLKDENEGS